MYRGCLALFLLTYAFHNLWILHDSWVINSKKFKWAEIGTSSHSIWIYFILSSLEHRKRGFKLLIKSDLIWIKVPLAMAMRDLILLVRWVSFVTELSKQHSLVFGFPTMFRCDFTLLRILGLRVLVSTFPPPTAQAEFLFLGVICKFESFNDSASNACFANHSPYSSNKTGDTLHSTR